MAQQVKNLTNIYEDSDLTVIKRKLELGRDGLGFGVGICILRYMELAANRHLLYSKELYPVLCDLCGKRI